MYQSPSHWHLWFLKRLPLAAFHVILRNVRVLHYFFSSYAQVALQYMLELVLGFLIPYTVIVVTYICILRQLRQTKFRRRICSKKLILAIVLTFCLFWLPYHLVNMVQVTWALCPKGQVKETLNLIWHKSRAVTSAIAFISSSANPVLYFFAGKSYIRREGLAFMQWRRQSIFVG
ncbi:leukotriene B4 receptor 1-like isoform X1 [Trematomus bernacchii]|uniref:leukotriene B4 receptor 1-like isoform X1 n=2 Tax=Trematomus bernacchii TaxID=40690 RepID=UPI00146DEABF|nr:leukotriene B4 receptor 1-like isoform X1 [Trematomus bernacchii]